MGRETRMRSRGASSIFALRSTSSRSTAFTTELVFEKGASFRFVRPGDAMALNIVDNTRGFHRESRSRYTRRVSCCGYEVVFDVVHSAAGVLGVACNFCDDAFKRRRRRQHHVARLPSRLMSASELDMTKRRSASLRCVSSLFFSFTFPCFLRLRCAARSPRLVQILH